MYEDFVVTLTFIDKQKIPKDRIKYILSKF